MNKDAWEDELRSCFESMRLLERCKEDTLLRFKQFCEFIAEPAFEALTDGFREFSVKARNLKLKGMMAGYEVCFLQSRDGQFQYIISLPKNSIDLKLSLKIRARKAPDEDFEETDLPFMEAVPPEDILKLPKEDLILDVIGHYKNFIFKTMTAPE